MVRRIRRKIRCREQRHQCLVQLRGTEVPIGILSILTSNPGIIERGPKEGVGTRCGRRFEPVLEHQSIEIDERPILQAFRRLPEKRLRIGREAGGIECAGEIADLRHLRLDLGGLAVRRRRRAELAWRCKQKRLPLGCHYVSRVYTSPHTRARRDHTAKHSARTIG